MPALLDLLDALGPDLLQILAVEQIDMRVDRVVIHDLGDEQRYEVGDLVLGVSIANTAQLVDAVLRRPGALLLRGQKAMSEEATACAFQQGVVLLTTPESTDWALLYQALAQLPAPTHFRDTGALTSTQLQQDLFELANGLAAALDAPITIEDSQSRLLAYSALQRGVDDARSATILGHRVPDAYRREVRRLGVARRLLTETDSFVVTTKLKGVFPRVVVALRGQGEQLGSVWAIADKPFSPEQHRVLEEGARAVSARLLHQRLVTEMRLQGEANTLDLLLRGGPSAADAARRSRLEGSAFRVLAVTLRDPRRADPALLRRCASGLMTQFAMTGISVRAAALDSVAFAVLALDQGDVDARLAAERAVVGMAHGLESHIADALITAMSGPVASVQQLSAAREETLDILRAMRLRQAGPSFAQGCDVASEVSLMRLAEMRATQRSQPPVVFAKMTVHDEAHGTSYLATLACYLDAFGDPSATAQALAIHLNTLRYRLRRMRELFGLDLDDNEARFALLLEFRLARIAESLRSE